MKYPRNFGAINVVTKPIEAINQKIAGCLDRPKCTVHCFRYFTVIELADARLAVAVWPAWAGQGELTGYFPAYCPVKQVLRHLLVVAGPPPDDRIHLGWGPADRGAPPGQRRGGGPACRKLGGRGGGSELGVRGAGATWRAGCSGMAGTMVNCRILRLYGLISRPGRGSCRGGRDAVATLCPVGWCRANLCLPPY